MLSVESQRSSMLMVGLACSVYPVDMTLCSPVLLMLFKEVLVVLRTEEILWC